MSLEEIRNMDYTDFMIHVRLCLARLDVDREFELNLAGVDTRKNKPQAPVPKKGGGSYKTTKTENIVRF